MIRFPDVLAGTVAGAAAGGAIMSAEILLWTGNVFVALYAGFLASIVFFIAIVFVGGPAWFLLHRANLRDRWIATLSGAVLSGTTATVVAGFSIDWSQDVVIANGLPVALGGAVAGWTLHRVAYGLYP